MPMSRMSEVSTAGSTSDGRPDAALAHLDGGAVSVLPGTGGGSFGAARLFPAGLASAWVRENLADLYDGGPPEVVLDKVLPAVAA